MDVPIRFLPTQTIAPETFLVRQLAGEGMAPLAVPVNTVVIRGEQPLIVDTGARITSEGWLERAFELVDPATCAGSTCPMTTPTTPAAS